jgi:Family of unknown function (DUF6544)
VSVFAPELLSGLDEPVRRYFAHAIRPGAPLPDRFRLAMTGRIRVGLWLPFVAEQELDRDGFAWAARAARVLRVSDRYRDGAGVTEGRVGRLRLFRSADANVTRSAAGRAALEAVAFAPACLLPLAGVRWRAEDDEHVVATWELPPERPQVRVRLGPDGGVRAVVAQRWRKDAYVACGCAVHAERAFGDFTIPSRFSVAWGAEPPFFHAEIHALA